MSGLPGVAYGCKVEAKVDARATVYLSSMPLFRIFGIGKRY
jgi:hypothetical protein